jgi:PAS domain S-box-containing protein
LKSIKEKLFTPLKRTDDVLAYWRERILFAFLACGLALTPVMLPPTIVLIVKERLWPLAVVNAAALGAALFLLISRRLTYRFRAGGVLLIMYAVSLAVMTNTGLVSGGPAWLFCFSVVAGLLFGLKAACLAVALNLLTLVVLGSLALYGTIGADLPFFSTTGRAVAALVNYILLNTATAVSAAVMVKGLESAGRRQKESTDRLLREIEERQRAEQQYQTLFSKMLNAFALHEIIVDAKGRPVDYRFLAVNPAFEQLTGLKSADLVGNTVLQAMPDTEAYWIEAYGRVAITGEPVYFDNYAGVLDRHLEVTAFRTEPNRFACIFTDVTQRKRAEEALRTSENLLSSIFRAAPTGIGVVSERRLLALNDRICEMTGYSQMELIGQSSRILYSSDADFEHVGREKYRQIREYGTGTVETRWRCKDGKTIDILMSSTPINPQDLVAGVTFTAFDITERKRAEAEKARLQDQLLQAQKMESVGRLAGGVAHDFNNMLNVIIGHADMALEEVDPGHPLHADLTEILKAARRSADLTRQLLAFARKQTISPKILDLNETVFSMLKMLQRLIGENIELLWKPGAELWPVKMDPTQIDQILANLTVNARDAIDGVGRLTIHTANSVIDGRRCADNADCLPGAYVLLAVSDTGCGMAPEVREHLFEPFFTTKEIGKGTGLGLATVYGIVKQNNGFIDVTSAPGHGTTVEIFMPRTEERAAVRFSDMELEPAHGTETVLLVEDEEAILKLGLTILQRYGYTVIAAQTPGEALSLAQQHQAPIHLLLTDVIMPQMNGKELRDRIATLRPEIKALFMSGYSADLIAHHGIIEEGIQFLQKPISVKALAAKVREVLDTSPTAPLSK